MIRTHSGGYPEPSKNDRGMTKLFPVREGECRAVCHPRSGRPPIFGQSRDVWVYQAELQRPPDTPLFYE